jgi:hypothetical protein
MRRVLLLLLSLIIGRVVITLYPLLAVSAARSFFVAALGLVCHSERSEESPARLYAENV